MAPPTKRFLSVLLVLCLALSVAAQVVLPRATPAPVSGALVARQAQGQGQAQGQAGQAQGQAGQAQGQAGQAQGQAGQAQGQAGQAQGQAGQAQASPSPTTVNIPLTAPVGGLTYTNPAATNAAKYYKIAQGQTLTFGWNFTSVLSFGTSMTIDAFCSLNSVTYAVATLPATATAVTWYPYGDEQRAGAVSFAQATYTMRIFDERGLGVGASPGLVAPNSNLNFAMYRPQPYTPLASWTCALCSGSNSFTSLNSPLLVATLTTLVAALAGGWYGVMAGIR